MNIAIFVNTLSSGGAESFAASIAVAYKALGHNVICVVFDILDKKGELLKSQLIGANIHVINLQRKSKWDMLKYPIIFRKILSKYAIDLVHSNLEQMDLLIVLSKLCSLKNVQYLRTLHSMNAYPGFPSIIHQFIFHSFDYNIGCGESLVNTYSIPKLRKKILPINNGVSYKGISLEESRTIRASIRETLKIGHDEIIFLQIGRMTPVFGELCKGHDITFKAIAELPQNVKFKIIFIGDDTDKNNPLLYNQNLLTDTRMIFKGVVTNPIDYIIASDCIIAPSRVEGLPISSLEAAGYGKPIICSDIEAFNVLKQDSIIRVKKNNHKDLAKTILTTLSTLNTLTEKAKKNINFYRYQYSILSTAKKYLEIQTKI